MRSRSTNDSELIRRVRIKSGQSQGQEGWLAPAVLFLLTTICQASGGQATLPDLEVTEVAMLSLASFQPTSAPSPVCRSHLLFYQVAAAQSGESATHIRSYAGWMAGRDRKLPRSRCEVRPPAHGRARIPGFYGCETYASSRLLSQQSLT